MMGDNRDNSTDSRVLSPVGYVPFENIDRPRPDDLLLGRRRRTRLGVLALAVRGALEPAVHDRAMNDEAQDIKPTGDEAKHAAQPEAGARACGAKKKRSKGSAKAAAAAIEARIGYRFTDRRAARPPLTHISALKAARNRAATATSGSNFSATMCSG